MILWLFDKWKIRKIVKYEHLGKKSFWSHIRQGCSIQNGASCIKTDSESIIPKTNKYLFTLRLNNDEEAFDSDENVGVVIF